MKRIKKETRNSNSAYLFCLGQVNSEGLPLDYRGNTIKYCVCNGAVNPHRKFRTRKNVLRSSYGEILKS